MKLKNFLNLDKLWDLWCVISIIGIWPRFIEPNSLKINKLNTSIPHLPQPLINLKILQISDLHLNQGTFTYFLEKIKRKIAALNPDLIVFTGDFLCYSKFPDKARLQHFFQTIPKARYGNYAILGNHDYQEYGYINSQGDYDVGTVQSDEPIIVKGFKRIFSNIVPTKKYTERVKNCPLNSELIELLKTTNFQLLHNETIQIPIGNTKLNLCGLGEYILDRFKPEEAFRNYDNTYPGIILTHNPDTIPLLRKYPGDIILCGHSHGGQINLPWIWKKFMLLENMQYKSGLMIDEGRRVYINRGLGAVLNFRWFCLPEMLLLELRCTQ